MNPLSFSAGQLRSPFRKSKGNSKGAVQLIANHSTNSISKAAQARLAKTKVATPSATAAKPVGLKAEQGTYGPV